MSWFAKIFGKVNNESFTIDNQSTDSSNNDNINVLEDLFVNNNPPIPIEEQVTENSNSLKTYFEQDFFRKGHDDGYDGHSAELLDNKIRSFKADFRYNLNLKIDLAKQEVVKLENHKIDMEGMSDKMVKQIDNHVNAIKVNINEIEAEIALSSIDEGLVMISIHQYRDGFIRGTKAYQDEKFIAGSTSLFN